MSSGSSSTVLMGMDLLWPNKYTAQFQHVWGGADFTFPSDVSEESLEKARDRLREALGRKRC
eukprot:913175-Amphidinium_carterae.1